MAEEEKDEDTKIVEAKAAQAAAHAESWFADFFAFRMFITRPFIKIIYVLGALSLIIAGFYLIIQPGSLNTAYGFLILVAGNLAWRFACEVGIVSFQTHDVLKSLEKSMKEKISEK